MPFKRFIEVGRVAYAVGGPVKGKLVAIVDIIDYNRALVDNPCGNVPKQEYRFMNLQLTSYKINIQHGQASKLVRKAWTEAKIDEKWKESAWAKTVVKRKTRASLTDFDRFKVARLKRMRNRLVARAHKLSITNKQKEKDKKKRTHKRRKIEKDPVKRKLKIKVSKLYKTLRTKGVLARNVKPKEKKEKPVKEPTEKKDKKGAVKKGAKKLPIKKPVKKVVAAAAAKKPVAKKQAPKTAKPKGAAK